MQRTTSSIHAGCFAWCYLSLCLKFKYCWCSKLFISWPKSEPSVGGSEPGWFELA